MAKGMEFKLTKEQEALGKALTVLQRKTVINVVGGMSNRKAYFAAGGRSASDRVADAVVSQMLANPKVKAFHDSLCNAAAADNVMTRQEALMRLTRSARVTITDIAEFSEEVVGQDSNGDPIVQTIWRIKNSNELSAEAAASIKSITATKFGPKLEMHDPITAIKQLAEMIPGWKEPERINATITEVQRTIVRPKKDAD